MIRAFLPALLLLVTVAARAAESPYVGQEQRSIKALSDSRVDGFLAGQGMGYAKAAELNGYAGPKHVLELAEQLELDAEQRRQTEQLFEYMQEQTSRLGRELVAREAALDEAFGARRIDAETLNQLVVEIAGLEGRIRVAHLQSHLEQDAILTVEQRRRYIELRGYGHGRHGHHR